MTEGSEGICMVTGEVATDECPCGCEVCLKEECDEYQIVYSG